MLGKAYLFGLGVVKDEKKAFFLAKKSSDGNFPLGKNLLGLFYLEGIAIEKDGLMASSLFLQAANEKNPFGMYNLARMYKFGLFFPKDNKKAIEWYEKAMNHGHNEAIKSLAHLYFSDEFKDYQKAAMYFEKYINKEPNSDQIGQLLYLYGLSLEYLHEYKKAYIIYSKAVAKGGFEATPHLYILLQKYPDLSNKPDEKIEWLSKGHLAGNKYASFKLYGYYWESENFPKALEVAKHAYDHGNIGMGCYVAQIYGLSDHPLSNYKIAFEISSKIFTENPSEVDFIGTCALTLAQAYENGFGVNQNIQKAIDVSKQSFDILNNKGEKDYVTASYIGKLYYEKLNKINEALKWYQIAYDMSKDDKYLKIIKTLREIPQHTEEKTVDTSIDQKIFPIEPLANSIPTK